MRTRNKSEKRGRELYPSDTHIYKFMRKFEEFLHFLSFFTFLLFLVCFTVWSISSDSGVRSSLYLIDSYFSNEHHERRCSNLSFFSSPFSWTFLSCTPNESLELWYECRSSASNSDPFYGSHVPGRLPVREE